MKHELLSQIDNARAAAYNGDLGSCHAALSKALSLIGLEKSVTKEHPNGLLENDEAYYHPSWNAKKVLKMYQEIDNASYPNITDIVQIEVDGVLVWAFPKL